MEKNLKVELGGQVLSYSSKSSAAVRETIVDNYDPKHKNYKNDIRILITTDILAEGVNLHRSNVVINYDIPWNPTRVLQRVGRVNRVDTKFDDIYVYNFFPSVQGNNEIKLEEAAIAKIQAFHDTLGEDAQYLTEGEEITSHELFNRLNSKKLLEEGGEVAEDSELKYLSEIRDIRDNNAALYEKIKRLPKKARSAKVCPDFKEAVVTFFKKGKLRKIYIAEPKEARELDFFNAAVILKSKNTDKREKLAADFYRLLAQNKEQFKLATTEEAREFKQEGGRSNEITLVRTIKAIKKFSGFTDEDEEYLERVLTALEEGALPKQPTKTLVKEIKKENNPLKILFKFKQGIPQNFFSEGFVDNPYYNTAPREVILSEYLINK